MLDVLRTTRRLQRSFMWEAPYVLGTILHFWEASYVSPLVINYHHFLILFASTS
jgi:hypothetical protein